jgi:hypothetical protein
MQVYKVSNPKKEEITNSKKKEKHDASIGELNPQILKNASISGSVSIYIT